MLKPPSLDKANIDKEIQLNVIDKHLQTDDDSENPNKFICDKNTFLHLKLFSHSTI